MTKTIRVGILECDTPIDAVKARYGSYGNCFERLLQANARSPTWEGPNLDLSFSFWDVVTGHYPGPENVDVILLTGSRHCAFGNDPWIQGLVRYVQEAYRKQIPIIGVCFGHQIVGRALGATVGKNDKGWEVAVETLQLTKEAEALFGRKTMVSREKKEMTRRRRITAVYGMATDNEYGGQAIQQMHRDIVYDVPRGFSNLGSTERCPVQGLYSPGRVWTIQGHPEFDEFIITKILETRHAQGIFDDDLYKEATARAMLQHDGLSIGAVMCKFIADSVQATLA